MRLINQSDNQLLDRTCVAPYASVDEQTNFKNFKANNFVAFRAMWEISRFDGDINNPEFDKNIRTVITTENFHNLKGEYSNDIGKKLKNFLNAWQEIKRYTKLESHISSMLASFHSSWTGVGYYPQIQHAIDNASFPLYFNVEKYLDFLVDRNGRLNFNSNINELVEGQTDYNKLAIDWRAEIATQWKAFKEGDQES